MPNKSYYHRRKGSYGSNSMYMCRLNFINTNLIRCKWCNECVTVKTGMRRMVLGALVDMYQCVWCNKVFYWRQGLTQPRLNKPIKKYID